MQSISPRQSPQIAEKTKAKQPCLRKRVPRSVVCVYLSVIVLWYPADLKVEILAFLLSRVFAYLKYTGKQMWLYLCLEYRIQCGCYIKQILGNCSYDISDSETDEARFGFLGNICTSCALRSQCEYFRCNVYFILKVSFILSRSCALAIFKQSLG